MPSPKSFQLSSQMHDYIVAHGTAPDAIASRTSFCISAISGSVA